MNDITLSGERRGVFSQLLLRRETYDLTTATYQGSLDDVYSIFVELSSIISSVDSSDNVVSSAAIMAYVLSIASQYRPLTSLIPLQDVEGLVTVLNTFRLKTIQIPQSEVVNLGSSLAAKRDLTDEAFNNLLANTLSYDNGTDLKTRIEGIDSRIGTDESALTSLSEGLIGSNILTNETSWNTWLAQHVMSWGSDTALRQGMLHKVVAHCCDHTRAHFAPNWHWQSATTTSTGFQADTLYCGHASRNIMNRMVYKAHRYTPVFTDQYVMPAGDMKVTDFDHVYDGVRQELRNGAAFMLGKEGTPQAGTFLVKHIDEYFGNAGLGDVSPSFPDDPLAIHASSTLLEITPSQASFEVPLIVQGTNILARIRRAEHHPAEEPIIQNIVRRTNKHYHSNTNIENYSDYLHVTKKTVRHYDQYLMSPDTYFSYTAPSTNHTTRQNFNTWESHQEHVYAPTRLYKTVTTRIIPNWIQIEPQHILVTQRWNIQWANVLSKPELYTKVEVDQLLAAISTPSNVVTEPELTSALGDYTTTASLTTLLAAKEDAHDHSIYPTHAHLTANHPTITDVNSAVGQRVFQATYDAFVAAMNTALLGKAHGNHQHSQYVTSATLDPLLVAKVGFSDLSPILSGYMQQDPSVLRWVSSDAYGHHTFRRFDNSGNAIDFEVVGRARSESMQQQLTQTDLRYSLHVSDGHGGPP